MGLQSPERTEADFLVYSVEAEAGDDPCGSRRPVPRGRELGRGTACAHMIRDTHGHCRQDEIPRVSLKVSRTHTEPWQPGAGRRG